MRTLFGISTIFLIVGLLVAPGCAFAAEFSTTSNPASDFKLSSGSEKINPEVKSGGSSGFSSSKSSSKALKKIDGDDDDDDDDIDDGSGGFPWWILILIVIIVLLAVVAVVWLVFLRNKG